MSIMSKLLLLLLLLSFRVGYIYANLVGKGYMISVISQLVKEPGRSQGVEALKDKHEGAIVAWYSNST